MKRYIFTATSPKRGRVEGRIYRISENKLIYITDFEYHTGCTRGAISEVFNALMDCGEIPKKWYKSSVNPWTGPGYFAGEVTKYYDIQEV